MDIPLVLGLDIFTGSAILEQGIREESGSWSRFAFRWCSANLCQHPAADRGSAPRLGLKSQIPGQVGWWVRAGGR